MPSTPRVLIVDDEVDLAEAYADYLSLKGGYQVRTARNGAEMRLEVGAFRPDAVVLDLNLGRESGLDLAAWLADHAEGELPAILFLSGAASSFDRIMGLEVHGDEFLDKPVAPRELLARIRSLLRRTGEAAERPQGLQRVGAVLVDPAAQCILTPEGEEIPLGPSEYALLKCFLDAPGRLYSRAELLDRAPASEADVADRAIDRRITRLRRKLEIDGRPVIEAVRGAGYRLVADDNRNN